MFAVVLPIVFVVAAWFVATGVVIALDRLPRWTFGWSLAAAGGVAAASLWLAKTVATDTSPRGAYLGFAAALGVWGWHEMSFLMGVVTGPRRESLPPGVTGWTRFRMAAATLIWHEIALAATAVGMLALTWRQPNQVAAFAFAILFAMRVSAKLNIFMGVPNLTVDFLPPHLAYLKSYFRIRIFNPLFPVSVAVAGVTTMLLAEAAAVAAPGAATGLTMLAVLAGLGCLEHWFLVLPFRDAALWRWAMSGVGPTRAGQVRSTRRLGMLP
jgi:putative photosynthetic complex assembly protein 2